MSALSKLPTDARQACVALAGAGPWPEEEWALAVRKLMRSPLPSEELGFASLIKLVLATKAAPTDIADSMIAEFQKALDTAPDPNRALLPRWD